MGERRVNQVMDILANIDAVLADNKDTMREHRLNKIFPGISESKDLSHSDLERCFLCETLNDPTNRECGHCGNYMQQRCGIVAESDTYASCIDFQQVRPLPDRSSSFTPLRISPASSELVQYMQRIAIESMREPETDLQPTIEVAQSGDIFSERAVPVDEVPWHEIVRRDR